MLDGFNSEFVDTSGSDCFWGSVVLGADVVALPFEEAEWRRMRDEATISALAVQRPPLARTLATESKKAPAAA